MATTSQTRLLLLESNVHAARRLVEALGPHFAVHHQATLAAAEEDLAVWPPDCVLAGSDAIGPLRRLNSDVPIVVRRDPREAELPHGAQDQIERGADGALVARAVQYAIERRQGELQLAHLALHDARSGLPTRALFRDRVAQAFTRLPRTGGKLVLVQLDVHDFRHVTDGLGEAAADALIVGIADRLRDVMRPSDTLARLGDDEFAILFDGMTHDADARGIARRVLAALAPPIPLPGGEHRVAVAIGIAEAGADGTCDGLLREAAAALQAAKQLGVRFETSAQEPKTDELNALDCRTTQDFPGPIRVVVCDDAPAIRALVRSTLEFDGSVEVVGEAEDGESVVALVAELRPDVVLLDLSMPNVDGLTALPRILAAAPWVGVVVLSGRDEAESAPLALALGAERFMAKPAGTAEIRDAVLEVGLRAP